MISCGPVSRAALRLFLLFISLAIAVGAAEAVFRVWYRDAGRRTLGGPGGRGFEHDTIDGELRGRHDVGPRTPGVPRVMVIGDSITYGLGVRDWQQTWPELLVRRLEAEGKRHELAVFATPGDDMPAHLKKMQEWADRVRPDVLIYQWYVNDIEAVSHRPDLTRAWQRAPWHRTLRNWSYLYFVADYRLSQMLPAPGQSYVDYLLTDFAPGTLEWAEFEREFNEFAVRAMLVSKRRLMVLYPQVPFRGDYPLQPINDRMRLLAGAHNLTIPPAAWTRSGGAMTPDAASPWKQVFAVPAKAPGGIIETADYAFPSGPLTIGLVVEKTGGEGGDEIARVQLIDADANSVIGDAPVRVARPAGTLCPVDLPFTLPGDGLRRVRVRVQSTGGGGWALADIHAAVDYGFDVVDLARPLNELQTHASAFDAHPNEAAHRVMAEEIYKVLGAATATRQ